MKDGTNNIILQVYNLEIGYPSPGRSDTFVRSAISVSAVRGEIIALIGPNGIGKSTLLKTLAGLTPELSGSLHLDGLPAGKYTSGQLSRVLSYVSTEKLSLPHMTVSELVAYGRFPYTGWLGKLKSCDLTKVSEAIEKVGIIHLANKMVNEISDGERQRTMIARALAQDTPLIILDEPTAFLDISNSFSIFHLLRQLAGKEGKTIILSTHDLHLALREMDKLWIMLDTATLEGAPEDAILKGWLEHLFKDDKVEFDADKEEFRFRKEPMGTISVTGSGRNYLMTVKALERKGYVAVRNTASDLQVFVREGKEKSTVEWELVIRENHQIFHSIYDLVSEL